MPVNLVNRPYLTSPPDPRHQFAPVMYAFHTPMARPSMITRTQNTTADFTQIYPRGFAFEQTLSLCGKSTGGMLWMDWQLPEQCGMSVSGSVLPERTNASTNAPTLPTSHLSSSEQLEIVIYVYIFTFIYFFHLYFKRGMATQRLLEVYCGAVICAKAICPPPTHPQGGPEVRI